MMRIDNKFKDVPLFQNLTQVNTGLQKSLLERFSNQRMTNVEDDSTTSVEERFRSQTMVNVADGPATSGKVVQQPGINSQSDRLGVNKVNPSGDSLSISAAAMGKASLQDAEDTIKKLQISNADVPKPSMELAKGQVLMQASTAMLAQANVAPARVLQLLG